MRFVFGASESISLLVTRYDSRELGVGLEELANVVDSRLDLRCLIPTPGIRRSRDGKLLRGESQLETGPHEVMKIVQTFCNAGWQVRLVPETGLTASLIVDKAMGIFYEYLNKPGGPFVDFKGREITHYASQFEAHWRTSLDSNALESLYDREKIYSAPEGASQLAVVSGETWESLIELLSRNPDLLHSLEPRKFEELVAELLRREGLVPQLTPTSRDGGRDILAFHETRLGRQLYLVECKRNQPKRPVDVKVVRQLYGVLTQERATAGLIVTTSYFTRDALSFRESIKHQMGLKDYKELSAWIKDQQKR